MFHISVKGLVHDEEVIKRCLRHPGSISRELTVP